MPCWLLEDQVSAGELLLSAPGLASSSEDEYESLIVREECGRVAQKDDEWSDSLRGQRRGQTVEELGQPPGPPENLLS